MMATKRLPKWYGSIWKEMVAERDEARRSIDQGRQNVAAGSCASAYYSASAAYGMAYKAVGMARVLDAAGLLDAGDRAAFEDIDTEVHRGLMYIEDACGWTKVPVQD